MTENRDCGCSNCYNNYQDSNINNVDLELGSKMLDEIRELDFAITDLGLYLDTHSEDEKALCLFKKYCRECRELNDKYQKVYGPLSIYYPCNKWRWLEEPWPWEGEI